VTEVTLTKNKYHDSISIYPRTLQRQKQQIHLSFITTILWQIDTDNNIRTGKLIKYNPITGKRQKKPYVATNWIHSLHCKKEFILKQCLFGEHY